MEESKAEAGGGEHAGGAGGPEGEVDERTKAFMRRAMGRCAAYRTEAASSRRKLDRLHAELRGAGIDLQDGKAERASTARDAAERK